MAYFYPVEKLVIGLQDFHSLWRPENKGVIMKQFQRGYVLHQHTNEFTVYITEDVEGGAVGQADFKSLHAVCLTRVGLLASEEQQQVWLRRENAIRGCLHSKQADIGK